MRHARPLLLAAGLLTLATPARADTTAQTLPFSQNWTTTTQITANDDWSGVPGITGFLGQNITTSTMGADPQTLLGESSVGGDLSVLADQSSVTLSQGDVIEMDGIADPTIALQGSGTADAPYILVALNTTGRTSIQVAYTLRHLDADVPSSGQHVALQYRVGNTGSFTNVPAAYVANAEAAATTAVSATLPVDANNVALVQIRMMTTNATGNDALIGIDNISVTGTAMMGAVCGNGTVETGEQCETGDCCDTATCMFRTSATTCRASMGTCDVAETCSGSAAACPMDGFASSSVVCRMAASSCDVAETCTGSTPTCPTTDAAQAEGTPCGGMPSGICDAQDVCMGTVGASASCVAMVQPNTTVCRSIAGTCDAIERCDGSGTACPGDSFLGGGTVCRAVAGTCDSAESCSGTSADCPSDSVMAIGTLCRAASGTCDVAERCNGFATCPADGGAADGTACSDGTTCNGTETCQMGTCRSSGPLSCDDSNACTADACAEPGGCENNAIAGCCNIDGDCMDDGDVCTTERCSGSGGTCESLPITGCCTDDSDCSGGSACVDVSCNTTTNRCETAPVAGCCDSDADCNDSIACTRDVCTVATGACTNTAITGCCTGDGDCDDGDDCSTDECTIAGGASAGTCTATPIPSCCLGDDDCMDADGSACTTPSCNVTTERCIETLVRCDDMDECTVDTCEADGSCSHVPLTCDDMDECTVDSCSEGRCEHTDLDGCGLTDAGMMMGDDAGMMTGDDAGTSPMDDAAVTGSDAGMRTDGGRADGGGMTAIDAGVVGPDAALPEPTTNGCSCAVPASNDSRGLWIALGLVGLVIGRSRRR